MHNKDTILLEAAYDKVNQPKLKALKDLVNLEEAYNRVCIKEEHSFSYQFSEYNFTLPKDMKNYIFSKIKEKFPQLSEERINEKIDQAEDYFYHEARRENKMSREYPPISADQMVNAVISDLADEI